MSWYQCKGAECYVGGVVSYDPAVYNSDSLSIVKQLQQGHNSLLVIVPSSLTYPMPYACFLASCNMGISYALAPAL